MSKDLKRQEFFNSLDPQAVSAVKMLAAIGPNCTINEIRQTVLKIGKHPDDAIGNSPLWIQTEDYVFDPPEEE